MNNLKVNEEQLSKKLEPIAKRPEGQSPEEAALGVVQGLSVNETATMVALGADALLKKSKELKQPKGGILHG